MNDDVDSLSEREIEILKLVATGVSNKEIASALQISPNTVKVHMRNIFAKIGVVSRTEATLYAIKSNIVESHPSTPPSVSSSDEIIYSSSPLAIADPGEPVQFPAAKKSFPLWAAVLSISAVILITIFASVLFTSRRSPTPLLIQPTAATGLTRWTQADSLPTALFGASSVPYGGKLYVIGGRQNEQTYAAMLCYDPARPGWTVLKDKPTAVSETSAVVIQDFLFIPGGRLANGKPTDLMDVYDIQAEKWITRRPMPKTLMGSAIAAVDGILYVFGGWDGAEHSPSVFIYNRETDEWTQGTDLPDGRSYMAVSVIEGHIQLIGGENQEGPLTDNLIYYPGRDIPGGTPYEEGVTLPQPRSKASSVVLTNITYLFGGSDGSNAGLPPLALVQSQDTWTELDGMSEGKSELQSVVASGNYIHLIGGTNGQSATTEHAVYQAIYTITLPLTTN